MSPLNYVHNVQHVPIDVKEEVRVLRLQCRGRTSKYIGLVLLMPKKKTSAEVLATLSNVGRGIDKIRHEYSQARW